MLRDNEAWRLVLGDALAVLPGLADASFDAVVTDPPYNAGCAYSLHDDRMTPEAYEAWCVAWFAHCKRIAKRVIIFCGHGNLGLWHRIEKPRGVGCWYKPGNPAGGGVFQFCEWEPWLLYGSGIRVGLSDTIRATVTEQRGVGNHPCPKPLPLMRGVLERIKSAQTILDPFAGSGTTGVAALQMGRRFVGIEIDPAYHAVAVKRLTEAANSAPLFDPVPTQGQLFGPP